MARLLDMRCMPHTVKIYMAYYEHGSLQDLIKETQRLIVIPALRPLG